MERPAETGASRGPFPADAGKLLETVVHALQTEATPEQRATLREELGVAGHTSLSLRIDHLEREHSELAAYSDALREFLDSKGGAREILESLQAEQTRLESEIAELDARIDQTDGLEDELATTAGRLDEIDGELAALQQSMADIGEERQAAMAWQSAVQESSAELGAAPPE